MNKEESVGRMRTLITPSSSPDANRLGRTLFIRLIGALAGTIQVGNSTNTAYTQKLHSLMRRTPGLDNLSRPYIDCTARLNDVRARSASRPRNVYTQTRA